MAKNTNCKHERIDFYQTGGMYLSQGEATDNIEDHCICLDCGAELPLPAPEPTTITDNDITF